jgi:polyhydroxyalkanoate synthesis regulator phasin
MASPQAQLKNYLDAGIQFTEMTRDRAERIVKDLVKAGEVRNKKAGDLVNELVERSRANTESLLETVRGEVRNQLSVLEVVTKDAVDRLEAQVAALNSQVQDLLPDAVTDRLPSPRKAPVRTAAAKASPAKKAVATKASGAKKAAATKASGAKKAVATKAGGAKKAVAKKAASAKKAAR